MDTQQELLKFFAGTRMLAAQCTQNGWPDNDSLEIDILERRERDVVCGVSFEEIIMEASGCECGRVVCWGRYHVRLDGDGHVVSAQLDAGEPAAD